MKVFTPSPLRGVPDPLWQRGGASRLRSWLLSMWSVLLQTLVFQQSCLSGHTRPTGRNIAMRNISVWTSALTSMVLMFMGSTKLTGHPMWTVGSVGFGKMIKLGRSQCKT